MKYACLVYDDGNSDDPLPEAEMEKLGHDSHAYHDELRAAGVLVSVAGLEPVTSSTTVRRNNGKVIVSDGPFAETKEQLGGLLIIEARDLNDAIRIASNHPACRYDTMEIRPVREG